jgi:8-oxo-dGTP pyrophosphatase MutT (NUDIX family)
MNEDSPRLTTRYIGRTGVEYIFEYTDVDSFDDLPKDRCRQTYGVCFCGDQIVIGYSVGRKEWGLIGGTIEEGETFEQTLKREIQEESNMEVLAEIPIGVQKVTDTRDGTFVYQLRFACKAVPHGPFVTDPLGDIVEIKLVNPADIKQYFDWGEIGDRIVERALELKERLG